MNKPENYTDIFEHLDQVICPTITDGEVRAEHPALSRPVYLMYDRMCHLTPSFGPNNTLVEHAARWYNGNLRTRMRVDRWHYRGHSRTHAQCRCA